MRLGHFDMLPLQAFRRIGGRVTYEGGGKSAPAAPDYAGAARLDADTAKQNLATQTWANRPELSTPWGRMTWDASKGRDPATNKPITEWQGRVSLSPDQQAALDAQQDITMGRSQAAQTLLGQATGAFQEPFDWGGLPPEQRDAAQAGNVEQSQRDAYEQMQQMLEPGRTRQQEALDTRLANMGMARGDAGFKQSQMDLSDQFAQQDRQMLAQAMAEGRADVGQQFQMDQQQIEQAKALRGNAIAEQMQRRGMTLNELNALLTGQQVNMPQMPGFNAAGVGAPSQNLQAAQAAGDYNLGAMKAEQSGGIDWGSLAGSAMMAAAMY